MTDAAYVLASLMWAAYGLVLGLSLGYIARQLWINQR